MLAVSVVIPCYNAAGWLPETLGHASNSLRRAGIRKAEFVIVDDGSTDNFRQVIKDLVVDYPIYVVAQSNCGRFLARKAGVIKAHYDFVLFLDTRVHIHEDAMGFVVSQIDRHQDRVVWNGHVVVAKGINPIARFADAITFIGWRRYFAHPTTTSYDLKDFDYFPKGTTLFLAPKKLIQAAIAEFEATTLDVRHSSDDTLLIRIMAGQARINLSPGFSCTYYARTKLPQFIRHTYFRGQFFVDGFLRPGNRFYLPLLAFLAISLVLVVAVIIRVALLLPVVAALIVLWLAELTAAFILRVPPGDALSLFILSPVFAVFYGLGIWSAVLRKLARRSNP